MTSHPLLSRRILESSPRRFSMNGYRQAGLWQGRKARLNLLLAEKSAFLTHEEHETWHSERGNSNFVRQLTSETFTDPTAAENNVLRVLLVAQHSNARSLTQQHQLKPHVPSRITENNTCRLLQIAARARRCPRREHTSNFEEEKDSRLSEAWTGASEFEGSHLTGLVSIGAEAPQDWP